MVGTYQRQKFRAKFRRYYFNFVSENAAIVLSDPLRYSWHNPHKFTHGVLELIL